MVFYFKSCGVCLYGPPFFFFLPVVSGNIFYVPEYRDVFVSLLRSYDEVKADK